MKEANPELPNFLQLIAHQYPEAPWAQWLLKWQDWIFALLVGVIVLLLFHFGLRKKALIPSGIQNFLEFLMEKFCTLVEGVLGEEEAPKHIPLLGSLFIYILAMNWFGLIPLMKTPTSNLSITAALAICVFVYVQFLNIKNMGIGGFLYHLAGSPKNVLGWILVPLMILMEVIAQLSRPVTLSLRLAGNMLGEHILMGVFALLGVFWLAMLTIPLIVPVQIPFVFLALLTGLMQALVFTMLSTVYIFLSFPHRKEESNAH